MAQTIKLKRSAVSGNTPSTSDLALGEIGINTFDGKIFMKKNDGTESVIEVGGSSGTVTSAFKTIAVAGQSNVVADSATDTLTFVAGTNMSITTSAGGDSLTFASTGSSGSDTFLGLSDSPANFTNAAGKYLKVNSAANALEYDTLTFSDIGSTPTSLSGYGITDSLQIGTSSTTALAGNTSIPTVLTDLTIADGSGGQVLQTNGSGSFSFTDQSGGNAFKTISVAGQSDVVADSASDTLTVVAGNNITLSTNPGGDSITIASTASGSNLSSSFNLFEYVATSNQTTFSGADSNSNTLAYDVGAGTVLAKVFVYYNGILLDHTTDYTATNGTSVVLTSGVVTGDTIQIGAYVSSVSVSADIALSDAQKVTFGDASDLQIYHDATNSYIKNNTGKLKLVSADVQLRNAADSGYLAQFDDGGKVKLYHSTTKKFETNSSGVTVFGASNATSFEIDGTTVIDASRNLTNIGTISSGAITGTTATASGGTNTTALASTAFVQQEITTLIGGAPSTLNDLNELAAAINDDANYNTTLTTALATKLPKTGGAMTGAITTNSTFDGRNVSVDGAKLDGIATGATNTSAPHYTSAIAVGDNGLTQRNFTNTLKSKLDGIATNANNYVLPSGMATESYVNSEITTLIGGAPGALDTLNELAAAINDEASYAAGITNALGLKAPLASPAFNSGATNVVASFTSTDSYGGIQLADNAGNVELTAVGNDFHIQNAGAAAKMVVLNSGNVGIGTPTPADRLHVALDSSTTNAEVEVMRVEATSSGTPAVGFGPFIDFRGDRINGGPDSYGRLGFEADAMPSTTVDGAFVVQTAEDGTYSERLRITSGGKVGIGTTSPSELLEVRKDSGNATIKVQTGGGNDAILILDAPGASGAESQIRFDDSGTTAGSIIYTHNSGGTDFMTFGTGGSNTERLRLGATGALELGYAGATRQQADSQAFSIITPASGGGQGLAFKRLDTNNDQGLGEISWSNNSQEGQANIRVKTAGAVNSTDMHFDVNNAGTLVTALSIDGSAGGNVGIGVTNPSNAKLQVDRASGTTMYISNSNPSSAGDIVHIRDNEGASGVNSFGGIKFSSSPGHDPHIGKRNAGSTGFFAIKNSSATEVFTIDLAVGKVGIGTTSPDAFLQIEKDNNNSGNQFSVADTEGASAAVRTYTHGGDPAGLILNHYYGVAGSANEYMRYADFVANVGNGAGTTMRFLTKNAANTYSTTVIDNNGNVGIDETAPLAKLHVVGGRTNGTVYNTIIAAGGANSTDGSGARIVLSGCENDPLARGTVIEGISTGTGNSHQLNFKTNNGSNTPVTRMTIGHTGNVGIGETSPARTLVLKATNGTTNSIQFQTPATGAAAGDGFGVGYDSNGKGFIWNYEGNDTYIGGAGGTSITIQNGGNVGIGTTGPSAVLSLIDPDLTSTGTGVGGLRVHRPNAAAQYGYFDYGYNGGGINLGSLYTGGGASSFGTFTFRQHSSTTSQVPMFIDNVGNVTVGGALSANVISAGIATTIASSSLTATVNTHVYVSVAGKTITLPASPTIGHRVLITVGNFTDTIIGRNGTKIMGSATDLTMDAAYLSIQFIYTDATQGWVMT